MFVGTIPSDMQAILKEIIQSWDCQDIYIGTSGNFTVERAIYNPKFRLHSNDVTLYSSVIGSYLAGDMVHFEFNPAYEEKYGWLKPYLDSPEDRVATILLSTRLMQMMGKEDNPYYGRMIKAYQNQWSTMHEKTRAKVEKLTIQLASYSPMDVAEWIHRVPNDQGMICYPPFFGETRDYEKYFERLEDLFQWTPPTFEPIFGERLIEFFHQITMKKHWVFGTKERLEEFEDYLKGMTKTTNRGVPIYVYSNSETRRIVTPRQKTEHIYNPHLQPNQEMGDRMTIAPLTTGQFFQIRSQYMNHNIKPGTPSLAFAVLVDGIVIGAFALLKQTGALNYNKYLPTPCVYLLSDFPVANTDYKKLAKLVLYAALSKETKLICERLEKRRIRSMTTTAFTNNPVSMKYRGLFKLLSRKENQKTAEKYELNYGAVIGEWTLQEGLEEWKRKHQQKVGGRNNE